MSNSFEAFAVIIGQRRDVWDLHAQLLKADLAAPAARLSYEALATGRIRTAAIAYRSAKSQMLPALELVLRRRDPPLKGLDVCICLICGTGEGIDAQCIQRGRLLPGHDTRSAIRHFEKACGEYGVDRAQGSRMQKLLHALPSDGAMLDAIFEHCQVTLWPDVGRPGVRYPIEHNPAQDLDARALIESELRTRAESARIAEAALEPDA